MRYDYIEPNLVLNAADIEDYGIDVVGEYDDDTGHHSSRKHF